MTVINGTVDNDDLDGSPDADIFRMFQGGDDTVAGLAGDDIFRFRDALTADDSIDGGDDTDKVTLEGDYSAFVFDATTMVNVEKLRLLGSHDYDLTTDNGNVAAGERLAINGGHIGAGNHLTFDGSAESDGRFGVGGSSGDDDITGGANGDKVYLGKGGVDTVHGGDGDDTVFMAGSLTAADQIDAGLGFNDAVVLDGDYAGANAVVFTDTTMVAVETLRLAAGHSYDLTTADGTVDSFTNLTLTVNAVSLGAGDTLTFDGSAEADSNFTVKGGAGIDTVTGGDFADTIRGNAGNDVITGGGGLDFLRGGTGNDTFRYTDPGESTGNAHDRIYDFDAGGGGTFRTQGLSLPHDFIDVPVSVSFVSLASRSVSFASFEGDIQGAVGDSLSAAVITVTGGDYKHHVLLIVDGNGDFRYSDGDDYVIDITNYTGTITTANFI